MSKFDFISPLRIQIPRKTKEGKFYSLSLNPYRNWDHFVSNDLKRLFTEKFQKQLEGIVYKTPLKITYTYFANTKRKSDIGNMCVVIDKFFSDTLTKCGCIPDDNYEHVKEVGYIFGGVDPNNGRVEIHIEEI